MNFGRFLWSKTGIRRILFKQCRNLSIIKEDPKTVILMIYPGGPKCREEMPCVLKRVLMDRMLAYNHLNKKFRKSEFTRVLPVMEKKYDEVGPATHSLPAMMKQAAGIEKRMNHSCISTGPHRAIFACQFVRPSIYDALRMVLKMKNLQNIIVLPMYPQFSCGLTGGALNSIYLFNKKYPLPGNLRWIIVDNWPCEPHFINHYVHEIKKATISCKKSDASRYVFIFAARPMVPRVFPTGDIYPYNVGTTMMSIIKKGNFYDNEYTLVWDPSFIEEKWLKPTAEQAIRDYVCHGFDRFIIIPISAIVESLVTIYDYDVHLMQNVVPKLGKGIKVVRVQAANESRYFMDAAVHACVNAVEQCHQIPEYIRRICPHCNSSNCVKYRRWFQKLLLKNIT